MISLSLKVFLLDTDKEYCFEPMLKAGWYKKNLSEIKVGTLLGKSTHLRILIELSIRYPSRPLI